MSAPFAPSRPWCNHRGRRRHWILIQISEGREKEQQSGKQNRMWTICVVVFFIWRQVSSSLLSSGCQRSTRPSSFAAASPGNELMGLIWSQMESFGFRRGTDVREMCHQVLARWQRRGLTLEKISSLNKLSLSQNIFLSVKNVVNYSLKLLLPVLCVCVCVCWGGGQWCWVFHVRFLHHPTLWHRAKNTFTQVMLLWY